MSMYLYGTGGIAVVAAEVLNDQQIPIGGFVDDNPQRQRFQDRPVFPGIELDPAYELPDDARCLVCIGDSRRRAELASRWAVRPGIAIHSSALVSPTATIGEGSMIFHRGTVQAATTIGRHVIINTGGSVDHDCVIGDFVHIAPHTTLCGFVTVGEGANLGAASVVIPGVRIGRWSTLGAGSVVVRDIPDYSVAVGCPARVIKTLSPEEVGYPDLIE